MKHSIRNKEKDASMKNKFAQLVYFVNKLDRRHIQMAYLVLMLAGFLIAQSPSDGGGGPI